MPAVPNKSPALPAGQGADIFLHVQTRRAGKVKGEAVEPGHTDDIALCGWQWGVQATAAVGSAAATRRRAYSELTVFKRIDRATTALLAALATNDEVAQAKLTMRRAGGAQEDYFSISLSQARVTAVQHSTDAQGQTLESVALAFTKVEVEYHPQQASGLRSGSTMFSDELPQVA